MTSSNPTAIVVLPDDLGLLQADVAGKPAGCHLLDRLRAMGEADIQIVPRSGVDVPEWYAGLPRFVGELPPGRGPVLIIDARAWLARGALEKILGMVRDLDMSVRVLESADDGDRPSGEARTIVMAIKDASVAGQTPEIARLLASEHDAAAVHVEASSLKLAEQSRLLDSFVALAAVEQSVLCERAMAALRGGVRVHDPRRIQIRGELTCGAGVEIDVDVIIEGTVALEERVRIGAHSIVRDARIGADTRIEPFSLVEASSVGAGSVVGPYGRIRPGSTVGDRVQIGNYVEITRSRIGAGSRINHHSFIGDADLAEDVTIGAGTITCNHDGAEHTHTIIERGAYVGSGCNLIAPVRIGEGATIGAGSTITSDVPAAKLTLARSHQITIEGWQGPRRQRT